MEPLTAGLLAMVLAFALHSGDKTKDKQEIKPAVKTEEPAK